MKADRSVQKTSIVLFVVSALLLLIFLAMELITRISGRMLFFTPGIRTLLLIVACVLLYASVSIRTERTGNGKALFRVLILCFLLYLYLLLTFTLADDLFFGRGSMGLSREEYMETRVNFRPFHTIYTVYIKGFLKGRISFRYTFLNLMGNLAAFMPFAFFLPCFFPQQRRWYFFLPTVLLIVCAVEGLQLLLMAGSCDVDDLFLNAGGAFILFWILKIPPAARFCGRLREGFPSEKTDWEKESVQTEPAGEQTKKT